MKITLEIPFSPRLHALFESDKPEGVSVRIPPVTLRRDVFLNNIPWVSITIEIAKDVAAPLLVLWLWKKFEGKPPPKNNKITIDQRREVVWEKGEIRRAIEERRIEIEKEPDDS